MYLYCDLQRAYLDRSVQQRAVLQALVEQTRLFVCVATDAVGIIVDPEQETAEQGGEFKTRGSLSL